MASPFRSHLSTSSVFLLQDADNAQRLYAGVKVPTGLKRCPQLQAEKNFDELTFARLPEVICANLASCIQASALVSLVRLTATQRCMTAISAPSCLPTLSSICQLEHAAAHSFRALSDGRDYFPKCKKTSLGRRVLYRLGRLANFLEPCLRDKPQSWQFASAASYHRVDANSTVPGVQGQLMTLQMRSLARDSIRA
jgi:hypothetical protein